MIKPRLADTIAAMRSLPRLEGGLRAALELAWAVPLLLIVAYSGGFLRLEAPPEMGTALRLGLLLFIAPALGEEILFRGLVIPRARPEGRWLALSVFLFVLWHPLQAFTFGPPWAAAFLDPWFLTAVTILGIALARMYAATRSLWPSVIAHWLVVFGWKTFLGGPF